MKFRRFTLYTVLILAASPPAIVTCHSLEATHEQQIELKRLDFQDGSEGSRRGRMRTLAEPSESQYQTNNYNVYGDSDGIYKLLIKVKENKDESPPKTIEAKKSLYREGAKFIRKGYYGKASNDIRHYIFDYTTPSPSPSASYYYSSKNSGKGGKGKSSKGKGGKGKGKGGKGSSKMHSHSDSNDDIYCIETYSPSPSYTLSPFPTSTTYPHNSSSSSHSSSSDSSSSKSKSSKDKKSKSTKSKKSSKYGKGKGKGYIYCTKSPSPSLSPSPASPSNGPSIIVPTTPTTTAPTPTNPVTTAPTETPNATAGPTNDDFVRACIPSTGACVSTVADLQAELDNAVPFDTVAICNDTVITTNTVINITAPNIMLCCTGCTVRSSGSDSNLFVQGRSVTLQGVAFADGASSEFNGGNVAIQSDGDHVIRNCEFENGQTGQVGGNVFVATLGTLRVLNSTFRDGSAELVGGGLAVLDAARIVIKNSLFVNNNAEEGGGLYSIVNVTKQSLSQELEIENSEFQQNTASVGGGFLVSEIGSLPSLSIFNTDFTDNSAAQAAGAGGVLESLDQLQLVLGSNTGANNTDGLGVCGDFLTFPTAADIPNTPDCLNVDQTYP